MLNILYNRHSTRKFLDRKVEEEKIKALLSAALLGPSSRGNRPWEFIVVDDPSLLEQLSKSKIGASFLKNAPLAIIIVGDPSKSDVWVEDCSIASILIQLEAEFLGLGSCWVQIRNRKYDEQITANDYVHDHFNIPERLEVLSVVGIGYKAVEKPSYTENDLIWEKVILNRYHD